MEAFSGTCNNARLGPLWFWGQKSNLHKLGLNDFEKIADNFFAIHHLLNYRFLQRNKNVHEMPTELQMALDYKGATQFSTIL